MRSHRMGIICTVFAAMVLAAAGSGCNAADEGVVVLLDDAPVRFEWVDTGQIVDAPIVVGAPVGDIDGKEFEVYFPDSLDGVTMWHVFPAVFDTESAGRIIQTTDRNAVGDISIVRGGFRARRVTITSALVQDPLSWNDDNAFPEKLPSSVAERILASGSDFDEIPQTTARGSVGTSDSGREASLWMDAVSGGARGIVYQRVKEPWSSGGVGGVFDVWVRDTIRGANAYLLLRLYASPEVTYVMPDGSELELADLPSEAMLSGAGEVEFVRYGDVLAARRISLDSTSAPPLW